MASTAPKPSYEVLACLETVVQYMKDTGLEFWDITEKQLEEMDALDVGFLLQEISDVEDIDFMVIEEDEYDSLLDMYRDSRTFGHYCFSCDEIRPIDPEAHKLIYHVHDKNTLIFPVYSSVCLSTTPMVVNTDVVFCPMAMV